MTDAECPWPVATDGEIAAINLESGRRRAWARFTQDVRLPGVVEAVIDAELLTGQFLGDSDALDRMDKAASRFALMDDSFHSALVSAQVAAAAHRFVEAREQLARAAQMGGPRELIEHQSLSIDQACGLELGTVLTARRRIAGASGRLEDMVPLGALFADLERFDEADAVYRQALYGYCGVSPFPLAWTCFQLGMLWGEVATLPDPDLAAHWYERAIAYLPRYVKARVHLSEIYASQDRTSEALMLLQPALASGDPEVRWRLADVLIAQDRHGEARRQLEIARAGFDDLLKKHPLAFADHAAEFYTGGGNNHRRALELARANATNRPTSRALGQVKEIEEMVAPAL